MQLLSIWNIGLIELIIGFIERCLKSQGSRTRFELQLIPLKAECLVLQPLQCFDRKVNSFQKVYGTANNIWHRRTCAGQYA